MILKCQIVPTFLNDGDNNNNNNNNNMQLFSLL